MSDKRKLIGQQIDQIRKRAQLLIKEKIEHVTAGLDTRAHQKEIERCAEREIELTALLRQLDEDTIS